MHSAMGLSVRRTITVNTTQARAFDVFVNQMSGWWPLDTHALGEKPAQAAIVEPRAGGRWFELDKNGAECNWGRVVSIDPPDRIVLAWQLSMQFAYDPAVYTEVEVRFIAEAPNRTRVELEHRGFETFGADAAEAQKLYDSPDAWDAGLTRYVAFANAA